MIDFAPAQELVDELSNALVQAKGIPLDTAITYVEPLVRYLQQQHGGDELYIPQPYIRRDAQEVVDARNNGMSIEKILRKYNISRRTYYRLLSQL